jgi:UDP-N-acetylglucosamine/UDP-N-acetylgalactosamine 4-epimerase
MQPPHESGDAFAGTCAALRQAPRRWLVTGSAGFIGSHLVRALLDLGQHVISVDNFATGFRRNLDEVSHAVGAEAWRRHAFIEGDIIDADVCRRACDGIDIVLHEAALGSVPRSLADPLHTHAANATAFLTLLVAARDAGVSRFVYASSSSVYGDHPALPKVEDAIGAPLSPYAVTKQVDELYAGVFGRCHGLATIGLRYFNVFGARQDPEGAYAAVIPRFISGMLRETPIQIFGDGETTRDFCYIDNVVQANILAAIGGEQQALGQVYNIAVGERMSLNELHRTLRVLIAERHPGLRIPAPAHAEFRAGDVRHSEADIGKARRLLGYRPRWDARRGLAHALPWYEHHLNTLRSHEDRSALQRVV